MKQILIAFFTLSQLVAFSQKIYLRSGVLNPVENINQISDLSTWQAQQFNGNTYCIIQFSKSVSQKNRDLISQNTGIQFFDYLPRYAFIASVPNNLSLAGFSQYDIKSIIPYEAAYKIHPKLTERPFPTWMTKENGQLEILVDAHFSISKETLTSILTENNVQILSWKNNNQCKVQINESQIQTIANLPCIKYLQATSAPAQLENLVERTSHRVNSIDAAYAAGNHYDGTGVSIAIGDDGAVGPHIDFKGRMTPHPANLASNGDHGDHVTGIVGGGGNFDPITSGNARGADLHIYSYYDNLDSAPTDYDGPDAIRITTNSLGQGCNSGYNADAVTQDQLIRSKESLLSVHSAGNSGSTTCGGVGQGFFSITGGYKSGKNSIAVGNVKSDDVLANSSSKGPAEDGRIKPEVVAVGSSVYSTQPDNTYASLTGTSMAAPAVAGTLASLTQAYKEINGSEPYSGLLKCILMGSADDLGNKGPDFSYGYGRINARRALNMMTTSQYIVDSVDPGNFKFYTINVPNGTKQIKVTLYWHDKEGTPASAVPLVNNLDLYVEDIDGTPYYPYVLDHAANLTSLTTPAIRGIDSINNVEQVVLDSTQPGPHTFYVFGTDVPSGPQKFSIAYEFIMDDVTLTYPKGGEKFVNGITERIRWDALDHDQIPFTLEYTKNNGIVWDTIATNIPPSVRFYDWTPPLGIRSGQMKIRITKGTTSDICDTSFHLFTVPTGLSIDSACKTTFFLRWDTMPFANSYVVYQLGAKYMQPIAITPPGQTYLYITGVNTSNTYYYAVAGRESVLGATGLRTLAYVKNPGEINCLDIENTATILPFKHAFDCAVSGADTIKVKLKNVGIRPVNGVPVSYKINANPAINEYYPGTILPGDSVIYSFTALANFSTPNTYNVTTWVNITFDSVLPNDTSSNVAYVTTPLLIGVPSVEDFEGATFPPPGWRVIDNDINVKWQKTLCFAGANGGNTHAAYMDNFNYTNIFQVDELESHHVNLTGISADSVIMSFDYAYANSPSKIDSLSLLLSNDCAATYQATSFNRWGSNLATAGVMNVNFSPTQAGQWKNARVNLSSFKGQKIFLKFRAVNANGNNAFIDNINIFTKNFEPLGLHEYELNEVSVYPNPSDGNYTLDMNSQSSKNIRYAIYNATGQLIKSSNISIDKGNTKVALNISEQASGIYFLEIKDGVATKKLKLTKF